MNTKVRRFSKITYNCRQCGNTTHIVYSKQANGRTIYVCEKRNLNEAV
jgi:hypothetical protein